MNTKSIAHTWRSFTGRERKQIETRLGTPNGSLCPRCGDILEARPTANVLECRACTRFHARAEETPEYVYFVRIQRLATAILQA